MATDFARRVKAARNHAKLTQKQLAPLVPMSQSNLSELETVGFGSSFTPQIAHACGVDAHWLATGDGDMLSAGTAKKTPHLAPVNLDTALEFLGIEFAATPVEVRAELADAMRSWITYGGKDVYRLAVRELLTTRQASAAAKRKQAR